jgi:hypothetical protein
MMFRGLMPPTTDVEEQVQNEKNIPKDIDPDIQLLFDRLKKIEGKIEEDRRKD